MTETTEIANPPALEFANLIITVDGKTVDFPDRIQKDLPHDEIRRMAAEAVAGGIPGLEAQEVDFSGYIVDPVEAAEGMPDRILLRPKTAFGEMSVRQGRFKNILLPQYQKYWDFEERILHVKKAEDAMMLMSNGERAMMQFYIGVWEGRDKHNFDIFSALKMLDNKHKAIIEAWVVDPFFP